MINWPENLPLGIKYGASTEISRGNRISTDMDYGNKRRRRRFTTVPAYQTVSLSFSDQQLEQFIFFYNTILLEGTIAFNAKVITGDSMEVRRCIIDDDTLTIEHTDYNHNVVSFTLEIYHLMSQGNDVEWLVGLYGEAFFLNTLHDPLQYQVNTHFPEIYADIPTMGEVVDG